MNFTELDVDKFRARLRVGGPDECWEWTGRRMPKGYGQLWVSGRKSPILAHRMAFVLANGPIDERTVVRHFECDNPPCCNPAHLRPGTRKDNAADMVAKCRQVRGEEIRGAVLTVERVGEMLERFALGETSQTELGRLFGVDAETARAIVHGEAWRHAPGPRLSKAAIRELGRRHQAEASSAALKAYHARRRAERSA